MNEEIFEVTKSEYSAFVRTLKPEFRTVEVKTVDNYTYTNIYSNTTNIKLCSRKTPTQEDSTEKETYYIFNIPVDDERLPDVPTMKINLKTKEEVQAFLNYISQLQKVNTNDRTI